jgi:PDZ domain
MSDVPPDESGGEPAGEAHDEMTTGGGSAQGDGTPGGEEAPPERSAPDEWWRREPRPSAPTAEQASPAGSQPAGTPPSGTPPYGAPAAGGTPPFSPPGPWGTPPFGTPPLSSEPGTPPYGAPPWTAPGWGVPPWVGAPQWYGWGPGWTGGPPPPPAGTSFSGSGRRQPLPWVIIGAIVAVVAMVGLGLGIGYSVWGGTSAPAAVRGGASAPLPRINPSFGRGGFLGVEVSGGPLATSSSSTATTPGAHVVSVVAGSPAAKAGIVKGDTITEFDTEAVSSAQGLAVDVLGLSPGTHVKVGWVTSTGKHETATVTLASRPASSSIG